MTKKAALRFGIGILLGGIGMALPNQPTGLQALGIAFCVAGGFMFGSGFHDLTR